MLTLPIKKKWFDMILSGEKKEEYREVKPYWITRFAKLLGFCKCEEDKMLAMMNYGCFIKPIEVMFKNGYSANAPYFTAMCTFTAGTGKEEWGAEKGKEYFILTIKEIIWARRNGVNMEENKYIELAKHCIGLDRKKPYIRHGKKFYRPYRNFFATGKNYEDWETMKDAGYADRDKEKNQHGGYTYWLTRAGLDWLGEKLGIHIYDEED